MSLCTNPYAIVPIDLRECIGISLNTINSYWELVKEETCLQQEEIEDLTSQVPSLCSTFFALSAQIPGIPKAFVTFSGNLSTNANTLVQYHSHNVSEVAKIQGGIYEIRFVTPILSAAVFGTCSAVIDGGFGGWINSGGIADTFARVRVTNKNGLITATAPDIVAVCVYG